MFEIKPLRTLVSKQLGGGTPSRHEPFFWNGDIPWASVKDFTDSDLKIYCTEEFITDKGLQSSSSNLIPAGTPLVCNRMAVGRTALTTVPMAINQDVKALFPANSVHAGYLLRLLKFIQTKAEDQSIGSTVKGIRIQDYLDIPVPIAPENEQPIIDSYLETLDTTIGQTKAIIAKLQQVKQGLLHDLLTRGIDDSGQLRPPQHLAPGLYKESPLGWIPKEWECLPLGQVAHFQRGHDIVEKQFIEGEYPVVSSSGVIGYHSKYTTTGPNVVVGRKGSIGKVHFLETDFWAHDTSLYVTNFFGNDKKFIYYLCQYLDLAIYGTKSGSPSLNRNDMHPVLVGKPSANEQQIIREKIEAMECQLSLEQEKLNKLKKQKSGLMNDLLTGKIRVTSLL